MEQLIGMGTAVNPSIVDLRTFVLFAVLPFNLLKNLVVSIVTIYLCKWNGLMNQISRGGRRVVR